MSVEQLEKAVESVEKGILKPDSTIYVQLLQKCGRLKAASQGRRLHAHMCSCSQNLTNSLVMQNHVINMYAKSGCLDDALRVFEPVRHMRNLVSWNTVIAAYAQQGDSISAMCVFQQMHLEGMVPDKVTYTTVLNACSAPKALAHAVAIHESILNRGLETDVILSTALVSAYCKCCSLKDARQTFDHMKHRNVVTWTALMSGYGHHGRVDEALGLFWSMRQTDNVAPNSVTFVIVINLCSDYVLLSQGRDVHACYRDEFQQRQSESEAQEVLAALVNMYGRCGSVEDAFQVFRSMSSPQLCSWNAIISTCARNGRGEHALELFDAMPHQPDVVTYTAALAACSGDARLLERGKQFHQRLRELDLESNAQVGTSLISMYGKCGSLEEARKIFQAMSENRNQVSWNAMLSVYLQHGQGSEALNLYSCMLQHGTPPNAVTVMSAVNACSSLEHLRRVHESAVESGVERQLQVCNALVHMYGKLGNVEDAWNMFHRCSTTPNAITWNGLITAYARSSSAALQGYLLLRRMHAEGVSPDRVTFISVCSILVNLVLQQQLPVIKLDGLVEEVVSQIYSVGYERDPVIGTGLIALLGKSGKVGGAASVFEEMAVIRDDAVPWNAMLTAYLDNGEWNGALGLFRAMQQRGVKADVTTLVCLLGCQSLSQHMSGRVEEWLVGEESVWWHHSVRNAVMNMLIKCDQVGRAAAIFHEMEAIRDVISWNVMISGYVHAGTGDNAVLLFRRMQNEGWQPDKVTYVNLLSACDKPEMISIGREIHHRIQAQGILQSNTVVATALCNMYSKCESIAEAEAVFSSMDSQRNIVSWNGMIGSYAQQGYAKLALHVFRCMQLHGVKPDSVTWINVLDACGSLTQLELGRRLRAWMQEDGTDSRVDVEVENATVNMLAKCGDVEEARRVFDRMRRRKTMVSWSAMVAGYAQVGNVDRALNMFHAMQREGERPNHITFISVLGACSHAGLVQLGCSCFSSMLLDYELCPMQEHLGCMIDLLGRAGWIDEARRLISNDRYTGRIDSSEKIQQWMTLLAACSQAGDVKRGCDAAENVLEIDPDHAAAFVALSNAHAFEPSM